MVVAANHWVLLGERSLLQLGCICNSAMIPTVSVTTIGIVMSLTWLVALIRARRADPDIVS